jgi:hypothetical protein
MKRFVLAALVALGAIGLPAAARAACSGIPFTFTNSVSIVDATTTNANNAALLGCATQVDNTQIGPAGIFPSQVISTGVSTGTFGGLFPYTFTSSSNTQVPLTVQASTTPSVDLFDIVNNARSTKYVWVTSAGLLNTNGAVAIGGGLSMSGALTGATTGNFSGLLSAGAAGGAAFFGPAGTTNNFISIGNTVGSGSAQPTLIGAGTTEFGATIGGVAPTLLGVAAPGVFGLALDTSGNLGVPGYLRSATSATSGEWITGGATSNVSFVSSGSVGAIISFNGTAPTFPEFDFNGQVAAARNGSATLGYLPPVFSAAGSALTSSTHIVTGSSSISFSAASSSTATVNLSGAAQFASAPFVVWTLASNPFVTTYTLVDNGSTTTQLKVNLVLGSVQTGTVNVNYVAVGS